MFQSENRFFRKLADEDTIFIDDESRAAYGYVPSMNQINDIVSDAIKCELLGKEERQWNGSVHYPAIQLALKKSNYFRKIGLDFW